MQSTHGSKELEKLYNMAKPTLSLKKPVAEVTSIKGKSGNNIVTPKTVLETVNEAVKRAGKEIQVKIFIFDILEGRQSKCLIEKVIKYGHAPDNAWLKKTILWAVANHKSVEICNVVDDK